MTTFALIGAAGYIAPRHMRAIKSVGGELVVALDPNDSVGVLDSHFPDAHFFTEFERFDRHLDKLRRRGKGVDFVVVCSPNYLHDAHIRFGLRNGSDVICEKPLVLNPWNIDGLEEIEASTKHRVNAILQLRLHPVMKDLQDLVSSNPGHRFQVELTYVTSRGRWYQASWKGDEDKSGGVASNIGIHFFDLLSCVFGATLTSELHLSTSTRMSGRLEFELASVSWFLSVDARDLPDDLRSDQFAFRAITVDGVSLDFSDGFTDLHSSSYEQILAGRGFELRDVRPSIEIVSALRNAPIELGRKQHPLVSRYS